MTESWSGGVGDSAGFAAAGAALTSLEAQSAQLSAAVASGGFRIEPEAATDAAKACRDFMSKIDEMLSRTQQVRAVVGFGESWEGGGLKVKFTEKATGRDDSLIPLLRKMQKILSDMAQSYEMAGRAYQDVEDANRQAFSGGI